MARNCTREVQELPPRQQQMRADGGGEVEPEGQEQPSSGAEKRGLADWSDRASAESSALGTRAELAGGRGASWERWLPLRKGKFTYSWYFL